MMHNQCWGIISKEDGKGKENQSVSMSTNTATRSVPLSEAPIVVRDFPTPVASDHSRGSRVEKSPAVLPRFRPDMLNFENPRNAASILFLGPSGGGKSVLIREFLYEMRNRVDAAVIINGSEGLNSDFEDIVPPLFSGDSFSLLHLENLYSAQKKHIQEVREWNEQNPTHKKRFKSLLVLLDDVGFDRTMQQQKLFTKLFTNGRNYHIFVLSSYQDWVQAPTVVRQNSQVLAITSNIPHFRSRSIVTEVINRFNEQQLNHTLTYLKKVKPYTALIYVKQPDRILAPETPKRIEEVQGVRYHPSSTLSGFFWAMASPAGRRPFRLGSPAFWNASRIMFDPEWDDSEVTDQEGVSRNLYSSRMEHSKPKKGRGARK